LAKRQELCGGCEIAAARPTSSDMEKRARLSCENTTGAARARKLQRVAVVLTTVSIQYCAGWMGVKVCLNMLAAESGLIRKDDLLHAGSEFIVCLVTWP
jgi:hypothetical protein